MKRGRFFGRNIVAAVMATMLAVLAMIPMNTLAVNSSDQKKVMGTLEFNVDGGGGSSSSSSGGGAGTLSGSSREEQAWNFFKGKGLTDIAVAGVLGNIRAEDGNFDPFRGEIGGGGGYGLIQWTPATSIDGKGGGAGAYDKLKEYEAAGNADEAFLLELEAIWSYGGSAFWQNMDAETSVGRYEDPIPSANSVKQFWGIDYKGQGSAYYFHAVIEKSGDTDTGVATSGIRRRPYYAQQYLNTYGGGVASVVIPYEKKQKQDLAIAIRQEEIGS